MKLIFVYNANSGLVNTLMDIGHKALSPQTYQCNLCDLTFGVFKEHKQWKEFRESSNTEMEFLHRDEFEQKYARTLASGYNSSQTTGQINPAPEFMNAWDNPKEQPHRNALAGKFEYPVILIKKDNNFRVAITQAELNQIQTLDELIERVKIVSDLPASN